MHMVEYPEKARAHRVFAERDPTEEENRKS
jgi:hypothetical protein